MTQRSNIPGSSLMDATLNSGAAIAGPAFQKDRRLFRTGIPAPHAAEVNAILCRDRLGALRNAFYLHVNGPGLLKERAVVRPVRSAWDGRDGTGANRHAVRPLEWLALPRTQRTTTAAKRPPDLSGGLLQVTPMNKGEVLERAKGLNPRPRPWQGRALPLSYTRIREIGGDTAPATGRAMPNAAHECNSPCKGRNRAGSTAFRRHFAEFRPEAGGPGSADCKLAVQGPIRARSVLEQPPIRKDIRRGSP